MSIKFIPILFLSITLIGSTVVPAQADQLDDALNQQRNVQSEQEKAQNRLNQLTFTADKIKGQLSDLDGQIKQAQTSLNQKQSAFQQAEEQFGQTQKELDQLQKSLEDRRKTASKRIKANYENGQAGYLDLLFSAVDFNDFITRYEYFKRLVKNDQQLLLDIRTEQQAVTEKSEKLELIRNQAAQAREEAAQAKTELSTKRQQQQSLLVQVKQQEKEEWEEVERLAQEEENWKKQILKLQAQLKASNPSKGNGKISTWPLPGYNEISSPFGWRTNPITGKRAIHQGIDIPAPTGTPIVAAASGTVIFSGWDNIYGYWVMVDIGGGIVTSYGHNSKNAVKVGQTVEAGDVLAYVGSTGWSTGPHVDFGVRINGNPVDPIVYFR